MLGSRAAVRRSISRCSHASLMFPRSFPLCTVPTDLSPAATFDPINPFAAIKPNTPLIPAAPAPSVENPLFR
eukprot:2485626-Rhodomonas_salina.1